MIIIQTKNGDIKKEKNKINLKRNELKNKQQKD